MYENKDTDDVGINIDVDMNCLSCTGNKGMISKVFKMACLNYSSSKVIYQNNSYKRKEILKIQQDIINRLNLKDQGIFKIKNLNGQIGSVNDV